MEPKGVTISSSDSSYLVLIEDQSVPILALLPKFRRSLGLFHIGVSKYSGSYLTNLLQVNLGSRAKM
jgi:hypothetical protein